MGKVLTDAVLEPQPMSIGQRALWFDQQVDPASNAYNLAACLKFEHPIARAFLDGALRRASTLHPAMRARFDLAEGEACCWHVQEHPACTVLSRDAMTFAEGVRAAQQFLLRPYDLAHDDLYRIGLIPLEQGCLLAIGAHHIVADLHSFAQFAREIGIAHDGAAPAFEEASPAQFAAQQRLFVASDEGAQAAAFWRRQLEAVPPSRGLGLLESGVPVAPGPAGRIDFEIDEGLARSVQAIARGCGATTFGFLLTAFQALLARHAGRETIVVGAPYAGRGDPRFAGTLGYLVNLLPMVFTLDARASFADALGRNAEAVRASLRRGQFPFAAIAEQSSALASGAMEATFSFQKTSSGLSAELTRVALGLAGGRLTVDGQRGELVPLDEPRAQFPLGVALGPVGEVFAGFLQFDRSRISPATAQQFLQTWLALVQACSEKPDASFGALLDSVGCNTDDTLLAAIERALVEHAHRTALRDGALQLSYRDLDLRSGAVATTLRAGGAGPGSRVAVIGDGGIDTVVLLLGVLRSGAAFVPMDAAVRPERLQELQQAAQVIASVGPHDLPRPPAGEPMRVDVKPAAAAWMMFTSGTTGRPKAAVVPHSAALAHARGIASHLALAPDDSVLQFASLSFDEHAEEIFPTLLAGACIVCLPGIRYEDPERLLVALRQYGITVLHLPTSYWHLWCDEFAAAPQAFPPSLRLVNAGGEQASLPRLHTWMRCAPRGLRWVNTYGLTEAAVTSLLFEADANRLDNLDCVPAGAPLPGTHVRIVGEDGRDVPEGASGELLLGGAGVGMGYFGADEATASRFFTEGGMRWLRTGDLARVMDAQVAIVGRRDRMFKVHGARVDLSAAEAALAAHPAVLECALDHEPGGAGLQAWVVLRAGRLLDERDVLAVVRAALAADAPVRVGFLDAIPRTAGRKPDYSALQARSPAVMPDGAEAATDVEATVDSLFRRLLQRQDIDPAATFFSLGGHSLLAMRAVAAVRRELHVDFSVADFMADPTVRGVAAACRARQAAPAHDGLRIAPAQGSYALSRAQRRVLAISEMAGTASADALRVRWLLRLSGPLDLQRVTRAWHTVLRAHPLLSAQIGDEGNSEQAAVGGQPQLRVVNLDLPAGSTRQQQLEAVHRTAPGSSDDRVTATCLRLSDTDHVLAVDARLHAVDGDALPLVLGTFLRAFAAKDTGSEARVSYARFVQAEADWLASPARDAARAWWTARLQFAPAPTSLGRMRSSDNPSSRRLRCKLPPPVAAGITALAASRSSSPFAVLLSAFLVLLARSSAAQDILIGVPVSLRDRLGEPDACGPTLNPLPFHARVDGGESFASVVDRTQAGLALALTHAPLPYEEIAATSDALRGTSLPIQFVGQAMPAACVIDGVLIREEPAPRDGHSPVGLLAGVRIGPSGIALEFDWRRDALADDEAAALLRSYRLLIAQLLHAPDEAVGAARMLPWPRILHAMAAQPACAAADAPVLLHAGLREWARADPQRTAIVCGTSRVSYAQLDAWSDAHAHRLLACGVTPGDRVALVSRNGLEEVVAACAVLKAGATYVPVAHDMPAERAAGLIARAGAHLVTGDAALAPGWTETAGCRFAPVLLSGEAADRHALPHVASSSSAYILFTSGSTGQPKGVEVSHAAGMVTINDVLARFGIGARDVLYRQAALDFDLSVFDIFGAFTAGATLAIAQRPARGDAFAWADDIRQHEVTVWNSVPGALDMLLEAAGPRGLPSLRHVLASGDWIALDLPGRTRAASPRARFVSLGGATEASIWSCFHEVDAVDPAWRSIPYGRALGNQSMFVDDGHGWPAPVAVAGEICIGGAALATGYWHDRERTAQRFPMHRITRERIYRTGDLGQYRADGSIEFLGRIDGQVKVRGTRVDPREVERVLSAHPGVRRVLVAPLRIVDGHSVEALGAYVLAEPGHDLKPQALQRHAAQRLTPAMRPSRYRFVDTVPLNANGKIDWAALPAMDAGAAPEAAACDAPATDTEHRLFAAWRELLPGASFGVHDSFFSVGGHSLLAVRMLARVRRDTGREVPLARWMEQPTIARLAMLLDDAEAALHAAHVVRGRDLRARVRLDEGLAFAPPRAAGGAIVITGATGLIGSRIVRRLLAACDAEIICINRNPQREQHRLQAVPGDLTRLRFGLDEAAFASLARRTSFVLHVGAHVNLIAPYEALAQANVGGTHEAIRLAAQAGAVLCHVSSIGVVPYGAGKLVLEDDPLDDDGPLLTGYCQTKWVAEQMVHAAMARGLRAMVFRPGLTVGHEGQSAQQQGLLASILALSGHVGCLPDTDVPMDLVDAGYAAAAIAHIALAPDAVGRTFHLTHPAPKSLRALCKGLPGILPSRPFDEWQQRVAAAIPALTDERLAALAALLVQHSEDDITPARIDCRNTEAALRGTSMACPAVEEILASALRGLL